MRKLLKALEDWIFEADRPDTVFFMVFAKFAVVVTVALFLVVYTIVKIDSVVNPHEHVTLDLTSNWDCTSRHVENRYVMHGKTGSWELVSVCDNYQMRNR